MTELYQSSSKNQDRSRAQGLPAGTPSDSRWALDAAALQTASAVKMLPSLYSNNSIETSNSSKNVDLDSDKESAVLGLTSLLSSYHQRAAHTLYSNVERLIKMAPSLNHVGFLTLTFAENITDTKEAYRRFRSFNTNFLAKHPEFGEWIHVKERQKRGAWHYHMVVILKEDIRTGLNFEEIAKKKYTSANEHLRRYWKELREAMEKYGLGRSELLPIRKSSEAMARYLGKYISKHIGQREEEDRGVRLVNYSRGWSRNSVNFSWNTENSQVWRKKLQIFARLQGCDEFYQLSDKLGPGWAYKFADEIMKIDIEIEQQRLDENVEQQKEEFESSTLRRAKSRKKSREKTLEKTKTMHVHSNIKENQKRCKRKSEIRKELELYSRKILPMPVKYYGQHLPSEVPF